MCKTPLYPFAIALFAFMKYYSVLISMLCLTLCVNVVAAQESFTEGVLVYKVTLTTPENVSISGDYTFSFKDAEIRKELNLDNGFRDITIYNCNTAKIYTLQRDNRKKYAIQLSMEDLLAKQAKFKGFTISNEVLAAEKIAGYPVYKGTVNYKNGTKSEIHYTKQWKPAQAATYNRFPEAQFFPLRFFYSEDNGISMLFEAQKMEACPVSSSVFRIPKDYKMISYDEYNQLRK